MTAAAYGARSRRMALALIADGHGCQGRPTEDSFGYYERAIDIFGELDGELSLDLAATCANLAHRRPQRLGRATVPARTRAGRAPPGS